MARARARAVILVGMVLACSACASALDPSLDVSQYAHTSWKIRDGFTKGQIWAIAQTPDGYLWLGTMLGLLRFDGVRAVPWHPPGGQQLPSDWTYSLFAARDGTLWIGTRKGLASWKDGRLTQYPDLAGDTVFSILEDHEGTVWAVAAVFATSPARSRLCAIHSGRMQCYGENGPFRQGIEWVYEDSRSNLWVGGGDGVWRWKPGPPQHYDVLNAHTGVGQAIEGDNGALLLAQHEGLAQLVNGKPEKYALPGIDFQFAPSRLFRSSDGSLWIGTQDHGLIHVHQGRADWFSQTDGLSGNAVVRIFEDREGNIWASTMDGLDRFREYAVPTVSSRQGLDAGTWSALASRDGSVWLGSSSGVTRLKDGQVTIYGWPHLEKRSSAELIPGPAKNRVRIVSNSGLPDRPESLFEDDAATIWATAAKGVVRWDGSRFVPLNGVPGGEVYSIAEDLQKSVWISSRDRGLWRVPRDGQIEQIPWSRLGHSDYALAMAADPVQGGLWLGFPRGGVAYFKDGQILASYTSSDGLGNGLVKELRFGTRGTLWAATEGGLSRIRDGHIRTLASRNGLPCDTVHWSVEDNAHSVWLYMPCGLVRIARSELDAWVSDPKHTVQTTLYDISDGVTLLPAVGGWGPRVSKSPDGRIWFPVPDGASFIDPQHLPFNKLPPPVHIEQITADGKTYNATSDANGSVRLPPRLRDLEIDYTALSLVAPEKVFFRYKLEGWDSDWQNARTRRQAFYSNLPPRSYRFRVMACNNSGVWNEVGASLAFFVAPAYYQTTWFRLSCMAALLALLYALYQLRLHQLSRQFNIRLEERVNERTRIARELHDTMLQSFQGLMLKLYAVTSILDRPTEARERLSGILEQGQQAIDEGRDAVRGMRSSTVIQNDLARALATVGERLAGEQNAQNPVDFRVVVEGESQDLHPILRDEVYRIASEATCNAFRHSDAGRIEVEICYDKKQLRVRVLDNGKGIDPQVLDGGGREGHYGLTGMRERAKLAGGKLTVRSKFDSGTEVELTIPASIAYAKSSAPSPSIS